MKEKLKQLWARPSIRLAARAVVAGLGAGYLILQQADEPLSQASLWAAATVAFWTFAEYFTPLNTLIGLFKGLPSTPKH